MGNCGCKGESHELDEYLKKHHKGKMQYEKNNYELAKQDRNVEDQNLIVGQSDLSMYIKGRGSQAKIGDGDN